MKRINKYFFSFLFFMSSWCFFLGCAKRGFPPGGPEDKILPKVILTIPGDKTTKVKRDTSIHIQFSETMDEKSVETSLFVSPNPKGEIRLNWSKSTLKLTLPGKLDTNRTYVVTIGTGAKDLHFNAMVQSYSFAFSTGEKFDKGRITGKIKDQDEKEVGGAYVWAYDLGRKSSPDPAADTSDYGTQTSQTGEYLFDYMAPSVYRIFAFADKNGDGQYTSQTDPLGIASNDVSATDSAETISLPDIYLTARDTTRPNLLSAFSTDRSHVEVRFDKGIDPASLIFNIVNQDTLAVLASYRDFEDPRKMHFVTDLQKPAAEYKFSVITAQDTTGNLIVETSRTASFTGRVEPDTVKPHVVSKTKLSWIDPEDQIEIVFSEAMRRPNLNDCAHFESDSLKPPEVEFIWKDPSRLVVKPKPIWEEGRSYVWQAKPSCFSDWVGNLLADSSLVVSFKTFPDDTLGTISGDITDEKEGAKGSFYIGLRQIDRGGRSYRLVQPEQGHYNKKVLPGRYAVSAYRDENGNGKFSLGQIEPFLSAERKAAYPDTLSVRSRWETQKVDVEFKR